MSRRNEHISGSMDSLLDTMTNVVGILVVLLAVTQLGVSTAVKRIRSNLPDVDVPQLEQVRKEMALLDKKLSALQAEWDKLEPQYKKDSNCLVILKRKVDPEKASRHEDLLQALALLSEDNKKIEGSQENLQAAIEKLKKELEKVRKDLAALEKKTKPPEKIVRIPNPRPAPKDAEGEWFVCRQGKDRLRGREGYRGVCGQTAFDDEDAASPWDPRPDKTSGKRLS